MLSKRRKREDNKINSFWFFSGHLNLMYLYKWVPARNLRSMSFLIVISESNCSWDHAVAQEKKNPFAQSPKCGSSLNDGVIQMKGLDTLRKSLKPCFLFFPRYFLFILSRSSAQIRIVASRWLRMLSRKMAKTQKKIAQLVPREIKFRCPSNVRGSIKYTNILFTYFVSH